MALSESPAQISPFAQALEKPKGIDQSWNIQLGIHSVALQTTPGEFCERPTPFINS